jgi:hypothetical protein
MTRDEHRAKCIEAIKTCHQTFEIGYFGDFQAARILDSIHGIALVCSPEVTAEMDAAGTGSLEKIGDADTLIAGIFLAMAAAGDLTNPQEPRVSNAPHTTTGTSGTGKEVHYVTGLAGHWPTNPPEEKP